MFLLALVWIKHISAVRTDAVADADVKVIDDITVYLKPVIILILHPITGGTHDQEYFPGFFLNSLVLHMICQDTQVLDVETRLEDEFLAFLVGDWSVEYVDIIAIVSAFAEFAPLCLFTPSCFPGEAALTWFRFTH